MRMLLKSIVLVLLSLNFNCALASDTPSHQISNVIFKEILITPKIEQLNSHLHKYVCNKTNDNAELVKAIKLEISKTLFKQALHKLNEEPKACQGTTCDSDAKHVANIAMDKLDGYMLGYMIARQSSCPHHHN